MKSAYTRSICIVYAVILFLACSETIPDYPFKVQYNGALKEMMKGDLSARVSLEEVDHIPNLYALGARNGLKGEILILDDQAIISKVEEGKLVIDSTLNHHASLLVYASVENWEEYVVPARINTSQELESFISNSAASHGIHPKAPFPFLLFGTMETIYWHVIDWDENDTEHTHEKHIESGINGKMENAEVMILGFYSDRHHRIYTHHTSNVHMHFKTLDNSISGHVDDLVLGSSSVLMLPKIISDLTSTDNY